MAVDLFRLDAVGRLWRGRINLSVCVRVCPSVVEWPADGPIGRASYDLQLISDVVRATLRAYRLLAHLLLMVTGQR